MKDNLEGLILFEFCKMLVFDLKYFWFFVVYFLFGIVGRFLYFVVIYYYGGI